MNKNEGKNLQRSDETSHDLKKQNINQLNIYIYICTKMSAIEIRMLRLVSGKIKKDRMKDKCIGVSEKKFEIN